MKHLLMLSAIIGITVLSASIADSQTGMGAIGHFEKAELSFEFPGTWKATDNSSESLRHHIIVSTTDDAVQISVISERVMDPNCDFRSAVEKITAALVESTAAMIHATSRQTSPVRTSIGKVEVDGLELRGRIKNAPATVEIYSLRLGLRVVSLIYLRPNSDDRGKAGWQSIRSTLKVDPVVVTGTKAVQPNEPANPNPNILNGRALHLGRPVYSEVARRAHASGTVPVQVTIDESGNVIAAAAIDGHPLLKASAVAAARESKFSPTKLCGEPVRVAGIITYNFVRQ